GVHRNTVGLRLSDVGLEPQMVRRAFDERRPALVEIDRGGDTTVLVQCMPLVDSGEVTGAFMLLRDVTELRRRDRLLLSKEATIREIHHRVKNNLQTISSMLRLQARRMQSAEAVDALEESVRRIAAIALVHETLAQDADGDDDEVLFLDIVRPLVRTVGEGLVSPDRPVSFEISGDGGRLTGALAMPLAVVLTELLQNAVDHAFPTALRSDGQQCRVLVHLENDPESVVLEVLDNGAGVPADFSLAEPGLGMSIVQSFICGDLRGDIEVIPGGGEANRPGTLVRLEVPRSHAKAAVAGS
ncbi:MAG: sensor histidine kinase, partial [Acidobacteria bacterium]|nr:sensor histidine kinase [Acidobacteriota bacterium]